MSYEIDHDDDIDAQAGRALALALIARLEDAQRDLGDVLEAARVAADEMSLDRAFAAFVFARSLTKELRHLAHVLERPGEDLDPDGEQDRGW